MAKERIAKEVRTQMDRRSIGPTDLQHLSKVSARTITKVLAGGGLTKKKQRGDLAEGLGWTRDSLDRIERGEPPLERDQAGDPSLEERVAKLEEKVEHLTDVILSVQQMVLGQQGAGQ